MADESDMLHRLKKLGLLFTRRDKLRFGGLLGLMAVGSVLEVIGIGAVPAFIAALAMPEKLMEYPAVQRFVEAVGISGAHEMAIWGSVALLLIYAVKTGFLIFIYDVQTKITEQYRIKLADRLFAGYMHAPYEFHLGRNSAELVRNITQETRNILSNVLSPVMTVVLDGMMTVFIVAFLVATTPTVALAGVVLVGGAGGLLMRVMRTRLQRWGEQAQEERRASLLMVNQGLGAFVDARVLEREGYFTRLFHETNARFARVNRMMQMSSKVIPPAMEFIAVAGLLLIVTSLAAFVSDMEVLLPTIALFGAATVRLKATISRAVGSVSMIRYNIVSVDCVFAELRQLSGLAGAEVRSQRSRPAEEPPARHVFHSAIELDGISYSYPESGKPALNDISLTIEKGTSVAFVGSTGSGKSTLGNVLLGLLRPQEGSVKVDGADILADLRRWHEHIGYVPQVIYLLDDTIRRNIAFGLKDEEFEEDQLWTAVRAAQLEEFVLGLENGLDTTVGERGVRLSGGQRQRIGLARALYHNPSVLIMDEGTSALDNQTESLVMSALENLRQDRTLIMIAHRLSTVRNCDRLYMMRDGRVRAEGTYFELSRANAEFRQMADVA